MKFKRFSHRKGITTIHFKNKDEKEAFLTFLPLFLSIFTIGIFVGLMLIFKM